MPRTQISLISIQRYFPWILLLLHFTIRALTTSENLFIDLVLYNVIPLAIITSLLLSRSDFSRFAKNATAAAMGAWLLGSFLSTYGEFFSTPHISKNLPNVLYLVFYPLITAGLMNAMQKSRKLNSVEALDAAIIAIGISAIGAAFLIEPVLPHFSERLGDAVFAVIFPVADLAWLAIALALVLMNSFSKRNLCVVLGIIAFLFSDFIFLSLTLHDQYSLGRLSDDGWLLGLALLSESFWMRGQSQRRSDSLHPVFIAISVMMSATLLAITSLRPGYLPEFIVIPTVATLGLAFVRMTIALKQARAIGEERLLARTDELTGLPNRRRFLTELTALSRDPHKAGALLLMDLDGFKPINDQFGHEIGDQLLREVSRRFSRALPSGALLARLGGDEFGALILGDYESTLEVALALKATLTYPFSIAEHEISVGVSVGHVGNDGGIDLLRRADMAMYQAKREKVGIWSEPARQA
jgi:diguanylate cyclase (GGDEF)-like protein